MKILAMVSALCFFLVPASAMSFQEGTQQDAEKMLEARLRIEIDLLNESYAIRMYAAHLRVVSVDVAKSVCSNATSKLQCVLSFGIMVKSTKRIDRELRADIEEAPSEQVAFREYMQKKIRNAQLFLEESNGDIELLLEKYKDE